MSTTTTAKLRERIDSLLPLRLELPATSEADARWLLIDEITQLHETSNRRYVAELHVQLRETDERVATSDESTTLHRDPEALDLVLPPAAPSRPPGTPSS